MFFIQPSKKKANFRYKQSLSKVDLVSLYRAFAAVASSDGAKAHIL